MPILVGLIVVTALVFYVLHMRAVAKDEAAAKQRASDLESEITRRDHEMAGLRGALEIGRAHV